jgi:hypothetical protein
VTPTKIYSEWAVRISSIWKIKADCFCSFWALSELWTALEIPNRATKEVCSSDKRGYFANYRSSPTTVSLSNYIEDKWVIRKRKYVSNGLDVMHRWDKS